VVAPAPYGGLERVVQSLAVSQARAGLEVHLLAILDRGLAPQAHPFLIGIEPGTPVTVLSLPARAYRRERRSLNALCRELQPTVVHTHGARVDVVDAPEARRLGLATVTTVHGFTGGGWKNRVYEWLQRRSFRSMDAVVAVSQAQGELLRREITGERVVVIPNAWDGRVPDAGRAKARRALGITSQGFVVGWVGRLSFEKGPDLFLKALARLQDATVEAAVVGGGGDGAPPPERSLRALADRLGVAHRVTWCGPVPDAGRWFRAFDALAVSSRTEGVPMVLFEAMAAEVPIVATRVGGIPEVLGEREAYLVPPEDPSALAASLASVQGDRAEAETRTRAARARLAADFGAEQWVARYADVYHRVARWGEGPAA